MIGQLTVLVVLIGVNAFFAATEIAFISLNDAKISKKAGEGDKKAKQIKKMLQDPSKFLATIQIGITLAGFLSSAFASDAFATKLAPILDGWFPLGIAFWSNVSIIIVTLILSYFSLVFGELVPKRLAMKYSNKIANVAVGFIRTLSIITAPFVKFLTISTNMISKIFGVSESEEEIVTEEDIRDLVDAGEEDGTIEEDEKEMINSCNDTKGIIMAIRYNKLWKKLIDENMMKVDLRDQAGITTNALAKLGKNEHVSTQVLEKVCKVLHCEIQDIMEFVPDEEREEK